MKKIVLLSFALLIVYSCNQKRYVKNVGYAQGTDYHIIYESPNGTDFHEQIDSLLHAFDLSLSTYNQNSIISKINSNESVQTDKWFRQTFDISYKVWQQTGGLFDITVAPLVQAYGFGKTGPKAPQHINIDSILQFVGMDKIKIVDGTIVKADNRITLDVNAIAQGFSVDVVAMFLQSKGIKNYMVEIGGEVRTKGVNKNSKPWVIGIDAPIENSDETDRKIQWVVEISDKSVATSGNYRKFYEYNGTKITHSINPLTGYTVKSNLLSATIITDSCAYADAYATACMVMGLEKAKNFVDKNNIQAFFIYSDTAGRFKTYMTDSLKPLLKNYDDFIKSR